MRVHRDPSLLTVKPKNLVRQWMTPLPGLDLRPHMPSTFVRSDSFMKDVKDAMLKGDTDALLDLYVIHYMTKHRLNDRHDAQNIIKLRRELETSKAMIFFFRSSPRQGSLMNLLSLNKDTAAMQILVITYDLS
ncbi:hypothetical protein COOONC_07551 [Cooperia oncophora]